MFGNKKFDDIGFKDIRELVNRRTQESSFLDYKKDFSKVGDKINIIEIAKDVSSFANTYGGWLIYGIETEKYKNTEIPIPKEIVGVDYESGLDKKVEDMILGSISPRPAIKVKRIKIRNSDKCLVLLRINQSYDALHMVSLKKEMRFYKRYEYQAIPMDEREIELRFISMGQTEKEKDERLAKIKKDGGKFLGINLSENLFGLFAIPKFSLKNHFDNKEKINIFYDGRLFSPYAIGFERKQNRFCFDMSNRKATLNFYYDGVASFIKPLLKENEQGGYISSRDIYSFIYRFLCIVEKYYSIFDFYGALELRLELNGTKNRKLAIQMDMSFGETDLGTIPEEIEPYIKICDTSELEDNKIILSKEMISPLFYSCGYDCPRGCYDNDGLPLLGFNKNYWMSKFGWRAKK